uniref:Vacuolar protein 8 n=1 Tax=Erpetoichthys calabaricus TaxID=27687 RepID=A0A8C4SQR9_ERPCA
MSLCDVCSDLLKDVVALVQRASARIVQRIRDCIASLTRCPCLKKDKGNLGKDREPVLQRHEREAAQEFLQHLDTGKYCKIKLNCLHALKTLSISENPKLQQSAAIYYLHISQQGITQLPSKFLECYHALLQSHDLEVQKITSLSLVNLLTEEKVTKETVVQMGLLEPILELLGSGDQTVQCNSCACVAMLATSASNREAIVYAGGILPLLVLCKSYEPRVQQNAVGAILNLTRSETTREVLCKEGALPLLMILLQSPDSEIQYYSCAALSNIATCPGHHMALLQVGNCFLLKTLLSLMLSSVEKVNKRAPVFSMGVEREMREARIIILYTPKQCNLCKRLFRSCLSDERRMLFCCFHTADSESN